MSMEAGLAVGLHCSSLPNRRRTGGSSRQVLARNDRHRAKAPALLRCPRRRRTHIPGSELLDKAWPLLCADLTVARPALTDEASPFALCSTRNRLRTAMHQGCASLPQTGHHWRRLGVRCTESDRFFVSNLSAQQPCDTKRSRTSPRPLTAYELGRRGAKLGTGEQCVEAALASHGRSHRFDPCHAHQPKRLPGPLERAACQKICQKIVDLGCLQSRSAWLGPSCRRVNGQLRLVVSRLVQLASLEHPISPVKFGWGDRLGDLALSVSLT